MTVDIYALKSRTLEVGKDYEILGEIEQDKERNLVYLKARAIKASSETVNRDVYNHQSIILN